MGNCNICGSNFKMLGGGKEPYTGCDFTVCNTCGDLLKKLTRQKRIGNHNNVFLCLWNCWIGVKIRIRN